MKQILSMIGGGMRGVATVQAVRTAGVDPASMDLLAGTSAGAINAAAFAAGYSPNYVLDLYREHGGRIFDHRWIGMGGAVASKHSADGIEGVLKEAFGSRKLGDLKQPTLICAWQLRYNEPRMFRSWEPMDEDVPVWAAVRASSAAPVYFPPFQMRDGNWYWDGGLAVNDPTLRALTLAGDLWDEPLDVLTVGTGWRSSDGDMPKGTGALSVFAKVLNATLEGNQRGVKYDVDHLCHQRGHRFRYANLELPNYVNHEMDDTSPEQVAALMHFGEKLAELI